MVPHLYAIKQDQLQGRAFYNLNGRYYIKMDFTDTSPHSIKAVDRLHTAGNQQSYRGENTVKTALFWFS